MCVWRMHASMMVGGGGGCKPTLEFEMILLVAGCGYVKAVNYSESEMLRLTPHAGQLRDGG